MAEQLSERRGAKRDPVPLHQAGPVPDPGPWAPKLPPPQPPREGLAFELLLFALACLGALLYTAPFW